MQKPALNRESSGSTTASMGRPATAKLPGRTVRFVTQPFAGARTCVRSRSSSAAASPASACCARASAASAVDCANWRLSLETTVLSTAARRRAR